MSVRVVARIRPLLDKELEKDIIVRAESSQDDKPTNIVRIPNPKNEAEVFSFAFNGVYDLETTQEELFNKEIAPTLKSLFQGLDTTIFAYGVTGTGKTHTMRGGMKLAERGVIPRLLSGIYRRGKKVTKDSGGETSVSVTLSYYEIYNDKVYDLFESPDKRSLAGLPLREKDGKTIVVGLSERECDDLKDFERLYIEANNNRSTAGTKLNAQSSRSHAILMVKVTQINGDETLISTASAIDLAGSEDNRRTENNKERMVESASINKSLFVLSQCVDAIGRGDKRIPYRESKMTRILSLGQNNGITIMILNLAPLRSYHLDTLSSLNVSSRAKRIEVREIENEVVFTQPPRKASAITGNNISRQPLRPLANAHNTHVTNVAQKGGDKPAKAFSVYTDRGKSAPRSSNPTTHPARTAKKRPSDSSTNSRPTKIVRPTVSGPNSAAELSASKIEEMIERKVSEALATRALNQPTANPPSEISEAVQRRLEALEKKIEDGDAEDERAEGLRFLLMAKQHKERGEDFSALKMYEMAVPFFPGQEKLRKKIDGLKAKIVAKKDAEVVSRGPVPVVVPKRSGVATAPISAIAQLPTPAASEISQPQFQPQHKPEPQPQPQPQPEAKPRKTNTVESDDEYNGSAFMNAGNYEDDDSFSYRTIAKPKKHKSKSAAKSTLHVFADDSNTDSNPPQTPRTRYLLDTINSRDVALIKGLSGIGGKKARDLIEFLALHDEEDGGIITDLQQLIGLPGMGARTVERAYEGIAALLV
ncbi:Kinesin-like protein KIF22 [Lachnellula arida]|uniref:Kinesin-like protein KIF22 n=1 Tax=Lachnellula arida TaxID=1316785 RepID=A0A8T9B1R6_9HELO|nr:Kinesin-like protein KIF22 [Lachnellula arida]